MTRGIVVHNGDYSEDRRLMGRVEMVPILFFPFPNRHQNPLIRECSWRTVM